MFYTLWQMLHTIGAVRTNSNQVQRAWLLPSLKLGETISPAIHVSLKMRTKTVASIYFQRDARNLMWLIKPHQ